MKKFVLGALLAATSFTGCSSDDGGGGGGVVITDSLVDVGWSFKHADGTNAQNCPTGATTANVVSQSIDPVTHRGTGNKQIDKFNCTDGGGTISLVPDTYLVWVEFTTDSGSSTYAISEDHYVDVTAADAKFDVEIIDDGGYVAFSWDLERAQTHAPLSCSDAGVGPNGSVEITSTLAGETDFKTDLFTCSDHYGVTAPLVAGTYTMSISVNGDNNPAHPVLGDPVNATNVDVGDRNDVNDIGNFILPID